MPTSGYYESDRAVAEYLLFHYGDDAISLPWAFGPASALGFPRRCVERVMADASSGPSNRRALDAGCAVGRSAFELSRHFGEVVGIDASRRFIEAARHLQTHLRLPFRVLEQGSVEKTALAQVPAGSAPDRVRFDVGDALQLAGDLGSFDLILAANLLDRVPSPTELLRHLGSRVRPGGRLALTSPYTWLAEYTPPQEWLSGPGPAPLERIGAVLKPLGFQLALREDVPFLLREHARKYQWSVAELSVWSLPQAAA